MLQRMLALGAERIAEFDTSSLRIIFCGGSQLPGVTATETLEAFGDVLYVLYGSTEVSYASITVPQDHREAPTTVGKPTLGTFVRLLDDEGNEVPQGKTGRIFVSNGMEFEGYTDGQTKEVIAGLMSSGDVGHFDAAGRLFIDGRDDDMIVSGGENVFPQEVEELLLAHPDLADAAVIGVDDEDFGQRLAAYVVVSWRRDAGRRRAQGLRALEPRPLQGPARRPLHRRAPPKRHGQSAEAKAARGARHGARLPP